MTLLRERYNRVYKRFRLIDQSGVRFAAVVVYDIQSNNIIKHTVATRIIIIIIIVVVYRTRSPDVETISYVYACMYAGVCVQCALSGGDLISVKTGDPIGVKTH